MKSVATFILISLILTGCDKNPTKTDHEGGQTHRISYQVFVMPVGPSNLPNGLSDCDVQYTTPEGPKYETITIGQGEGYTWNKYFGSNDLNSGSYVELEFNTNNDRIRGSIHFDSEMWIYDYVKYFEGTKRIYGTVP